MAKVSELMSNNIEWMKKNQQTWSIFYNMKEEGAKGDGVADDKATLSKIITKLNGKDGVVIFPGGDYRIASNLTIPKNVYLYFVGEGYLVLDSGVTLTINGGILAGPYQIFKGEGNANGSNVIVDQFYPEWWGAKGDGITDDTVAITKTVDMASNSTILFFNKTYLVTNATLLNPLNSTVYKAEGTLSRFLYEGQSYIIPLGTSLFSNGDDKVTVSIGGNIKTIELTGTDLLGMRNDLVQQNVRINSVQNQVNTLIVSGDSSPAAAQAAIDSGGYDYGNLKVRLDTEHTSVTSQLADIGYNVKVFGAKADGVTADADMFSAAAAMNGLVIVPKGDYYIEKDTARAFWLLMPGANILGLPLVGDVAKTQDTSRLKGRVIHLSDNVFEGIRIGDTEPWLEKDVRKPSQVISEVTVLSPTGQVAITGASRTSDDPTPNMAAIGIAGYGINDNTTNREPAWAQYLEARRYAGAGPTMNTEMDMVNLGDVFDLTPYSAMSEITGQTVNVWLSSGGGGVTGANNSSAAIVVLPNPKQFKRGIVFRGDALDFAVNEMLTGPMGSAVAWYDQEGRQSYISGELFHQSRKSDTSPIYHEYTRLRDNGIDPTQPLDIIQRTNYLAFNGISPLPVAHQQVIQRAAYAGYQARFSYDITTMGDGGVEHQVSLNGMANASFAAYPDNAISLGSPSGRWSQVYAGTATISTSDINTKRDVALIDNDLIEAFLSIQPRVYRFNDAYDIKGNDARYHMGFIAQELEQALVSKGLNPADYGIWCKDEVMSAEKDDNGVVTLTPTGEFIQGLRYENFIALMEAANRKRFEAIEDRLAALESVQ